MSTTTIRRRFKIGGALADADSAVLRDPTGAYGVRRRDTGAIVVAANTALTRVSLGLYTYTFTDPAPGLTYDFYIKFVDGTETHYFQDSIAGGREGNLYDLIPRIAPYVGACPEPVLKQHLRQAAVDFCNETGIWKEDLTAIPSVTDEDEYVLDPEHDDVTIKRVTEVELAETPIAYTFSAATSTLTFVHAPTQDDQDIVPTVVYLPNHACTVYPTWLLDKWGEAIVQGALARLHSISGTSWFNVDLFQLEYGQFRAYITNAKVFLLTKGGNPNLTVQKREFV